MRQRTGQAIERAAVADEGQQALGQRRPLGVAVRRQQLAHRQTAAPQRDQHVVDDAHLAEQLRRLVGAGDAGAGNLVRGEACDVAAGKPIEPWSGR